MGWLTSKLSRIVWRKVYHTSKIKYYNISIANSTVRESWKRLKWNRTWNLLLISKRFRCTFCIMGSLVKYLATLNL